MASRRVLIISNNIDSIVKFRAKVIRSLLDAGFEVHVTAPIDASTTGVSTQEVRALGVQFHPLKMAAASISPFKDLLMIAALAKLSRKLNPECCLTYTIKPNTFGILAVKLGAPSCRIVGIMNGLGLTLIDASLASAPIRGLVKWLYRISFGFASRVFFHNQQDASYFIKHRLVSDSKISVVAGSGIDLNVFYPDHDVPSKSSILFIGRLIKEKGIYELIEAMRVIRKNHPGLKLEVIGSTYPSPTSVSEDELTRWQTEGLIDFHGRQHDVLPFLRRAAIVVLPSYREGLSRVLIEAAACGKAIVTTDAPGCKDAIIDGQSGLLVPVKDSQALAMALNTLLSNPQRANEMGKVGRQLAQEHFGAGPIAQKIVEALTHA